MTERPTGGQEPVNPAGPKDASGRHATTPEPRQLMRFAQEDERWTMRHQLRDWMWLGLMIIGFCAWTLLVFFLEPGLR